MDGFLTFENVFYNVVVFCDLRGIQLMPVFGFLENVILNQDSNVREHLNNFWVILCVCVCYKRQKASDWWGGIGS